MIKMGKMKKDSKEYYEFKKTVKFLKLQKGQGTELISVYIKPNQNVNEITNRLRDEYGQAANIKSKSTKKNVQAAIDRILGMLKGVNKAPEKGVAIFSGSINGNIELFNVIPPEELGTSIYRCDSNFYMDPLEDLVDIKEMHGLFVMDRREATLALLKGKKITIVRHLTSTVPGKHHKGGQSAMRFTRLIEEAVHNFFKEIGEACNKEFADKKVVGVIAGGSGPTKHAFLKGDYLFNNVKEKVIATIDTSYTDEFGIHELMQKSQEAIAQLDVMKEKELVNKFLKEAVTNGLATYGKNEVIDAINRNQAELILLSEGLDEKIVEEIIELANQTGAEVEMISEDTPEGQQFKIGFLGIGALLRYK